jgi:hypothetical protein
MAHPILFGANPGGFYVRANAFKDWRTGGGALGFTETCAGAVCDPAAGDVQTTTFQFRKGATDRLNGCIGAPVVSACFYPGAGCVRVSHDLFQLTSGGACKTTPWGKVSVEVSATKDLDFGLNHKIYLERPDATNSVTEVYFTLAHSIGGWLNDAPLKIWFAAPQAPAE